MSKTVKEATVKNEVLSINFTSDFLSKVFNSDINSSEDLFSIVKDTILNDKDLRDKYLNDDSKMVSNFNEKIKLDIAEGVECLKRMKLAHSFVDGKFTLLSEPSVVYQYNTYSWQSDKNEGQDLNSLLKDINSKYWKYGTSYFEKLTKEIIKNHAIYAY